MKGKKSTNNIVIVYDDDNSIVMQIGDLPMSTEMAKLKDQCAKKESEIKYLDSLKLKAKEQ